MLAFPTIGYYQCEIHSEVLAALFVIALVTIPAAATALAGRRALRRGLPGE
jgi:hypothetical protein